MAISSAICSSFKQEILVGTHNFTASSGNTFKIALFTSSASLGASTTAYSTSNEISNTSGSSYSAGGATLTSVTPALDGTTAVCDFSDVLLISFDVEYAVVEAPKDASLVNKAILKVFPLDAVKLCVPTKISCLKLEQIADDIAII